MYCMYEKVRGKRWIWSHLCVLRGRILHDRRVLFVQVVRQNLVLPGHNINSYFHRLGGWVSGTPPSTPSPSEILLTPSADTHPHRLYIPTPSSPDIHPRHPPDPIRPELPLVFSKTHMWPNSPFFPLTHSYVCLCLCALHWPADEVIQKQHVYFYVFVWHEESFDWIFILRNFLYLYVGAPSELKSFSKF